MKRAILTVLVVLGLAQSAKAEEPDDAKWENDAAVMRLFRPALKPGVDILVGGDEAALYKVYREVRAGRVAVVMGDMTAKATTLRGGKGVETRISANQLVYVFDKFISTLTPNDARRLLMVMAQGGWPAEVFKQTVDYFGDDNGGDRARWVAREIDSAGLEVYSFDSFVDLDIKNERAHQYYVDNPDAYKYLLVDARVIAKDTGVGGGVSYYDRLWAALLEGNPDKALKVIRSVPHYAFAKAWKRELTAADLEPAQGYAFACKKLGGANTDTTVEKALGAPAKWWYDRTLNNGLGATKSYWFMPGYDFWATFDSNGKLVDSPCSSLSAERAPATKKTKKAEAE